jgi:hypothetical protein
MHERVTAALSRRFATVIRDSSGMRTTTAPMGSSARF